MKTYHIRKTTKRATNEIVEENGYATMFLYDKNLNIKCKTLIDIEDIEKCKPFKWSLHNGNYVHYSAGGMLLHRYIIDCPEGFEVDHINHNKLDNRKSNLRIVTPSDNGKNKGIRVDNKSGASGVNWCNTMQRWRARVYQNGKTISIGYFLNREDAIRARKQAEIEYYGEYKYFAASY